MGQYFKRETIESYKSYKSYNDQTVLGAVKAAWYIINIFPCNVVWNLFMIPADAVDGGNGGLSMICAGCCGCFAILPLLIVFLFCLPFGIVAALAALIFGLLRLVLQSS